MPGWDQCASSIALRCGSLIPATGRHHHDMTEMTLKMTLNWITHTQSENVSHFPLSCLLSYVNIITWKLFCKKKKLVQVLNSPVYIHLYMWIICDYVYTCLLVDTCCVNIHVHYMNIDVMTISTKWLLPHQVKQVVAFDLDCTWWSVLEHLSSGWEVMGSIPSWDIPMTKKWDLVLPC